jgi:hypothetical protein
MLSPSYRVSRAFAVAVLLLGIAVLLGWASDWTVLKSVLPHFVAMKPNTALGFALSGIALHFLAPFKPAPANKPAWMRVWVPVWIGRGCALVVAFLGFSTLAQHLFGMDELVFKDDLRPIATTHPGRMAFT